MNRWKGKHPGPYEFFHTFNDVAEQNLDWFWKPWFFEFGYPDLSVEIAKMDNVGSNSYFVAYVTREGNIPVALDLSVEYDDGSTERYRRTMDSWKHLDKKVMQVPLARDKVPVKATLGGKTIPDAKPKNNVWQAK